MPIILPLALTPPEIRVLQEFRRLASDTLPLATLVAIRHPAGGGEAPVGLLAERGFLQADPGGESFTVTGKGREFLAIEAKPETAEPAEPNASNASAAASDGA